jgi:hypothetical protein
MVCFDAANKTFFCDSTKENETVLFNLQEILKKLLFRIFAFRRINGSFKNAF